MVLVHVIVMGVIMETCKCGDPKSVHRDETEECQFEYREGDSEFEWVLATCPCTQFRPER